MAQESKIEAKLKKEVEARGGKAFKFVSPGMSGVPDRIVLVPGGRAIFVELKAPDGKLAVLQGKRKEELQVLGFEVHCLYSIAGVVGFIEEVFK